MATNHDQAIHLLERFTHAHGASGNEAAVRDVFREELDGIGEFATDRMGGIACHFGKGGEAPRILLAGHLDEVGFMVQDIRDDGFLQFVSVGGWWPHTLLAQRVRIKTRSGIEVLGVITSLPPHFLSDQERSRVQKIDTLFIDIGAASGAEVRDDYGIQLGDTIVPDSAFTPFGKCGLYLAKAFDNRVGMAVAVQATQQLAAGATASIPNHLITAGTAQEEVGTRGARPLARMTKPDVALVMEGTPADDTPGSSKTAPQGRVGGGVQIRVADPSAIMNRSLVDHVITVAKHHHISHQIAVRRSGGTDAAAFHLSGHGIPSVVLGVPARYIHSHNSVISIDDYLSALDLVTALVPTLDAPTVASFTNYLR